MKINDLYSDFPEINWVQNKNNMWIDGYYNDTRLFSVDVASDKIKLRNDFRKKYLIPNEFLPEFTEKHNFICSTDSFIDYSYNKKYIKTFFNDMITYIKKFIIFEQKGILNEEFASCRR